uniref:DDE_3 domain-containing protein n=1 Tax=Heterorhabditis bacteriophora TaxID=37862 RepID=A0A1I7X8Z6_HETBA
MDSIISSTIIVRKLQGYSTAAITREIQRTHSNITYRRVLNFIRAHKRQRARVSQPFRGRKFVASEVEEIKSLISYIYATNNEVTSMKLIKMLGFVCKITKSDHLIRSVNKEKRLKFYTHMLDIKESFSDCVFTDESSVQLNSNSRICFVQEKDAVGRRRSVAKYPLKVHVWAGISRRGATRIAIWDGKDNDPKHTDKYTRDRFAKLGIKCVDWPPESPDLNPIEKVWHQLKHNLRTEYKLVSKDTLIAGIRQFWKTRITVDQCCRYIDY